MTMATADHTTLTEMAIARVQGFFTASGLTPTAFARAAGVHKRACQGIDRDTWRPPSIDALEKLERAVTRLERQPTEEKQ